MSIDLWTPARTAEALSVPEATLKRWRYAGGGPVFHRVGRHVRYDPQDVEEWLRRNRRSAEDLAGKA